MNIVKTVSERWSNYWRRRALINELHALDSADTRQLVHDTGLSFANLMALAKTSGDAANLLYQRMHEMGLDPKRIDAAVLREMQVSCSLCDSKALCAHELEDKPKGTSWPSYCPNKDVLEELRRMASH